VVTLADDAYLGLETRFKVVVDGVDLGGWHSCTGLSVNFNLEAIPEGGENGYKHWLPGHVDYPKITLKRAMSADDAPKVQQWLSSKVDTFDGGTAQITLLDSRGTPVFEWSLRNVHPSQWKGPDLNAGSLNVALETLELAHEGFL
jgi:phage tail-like protein